MTTTDPAEQFLAALCDDEYHRCHRCGHWLATKFEFDRKVCELCRDELGVARGLLWVGAIELFVIAIALAVRCLMRFLT